MFVVLDWVPVDHLVARLEVDSVCVNEECIRWCL